MVSHHQAQSTCFARSFSILEVFAPSPLPSVPPRKARLLGTRLLMRTSAADGKAGQKRGG